MTTVTFSSPTVPPLPPGIEQELQRIRAYPDDDLPRLLYADWLEQRDEPRAEFIRIQIARARLEAWLAAATEPHPHAVPEGKSQPSRLPLSQYMQLHRQLVNRESSLLARYRGQWLMPMRGIICGAEFRRGFVESIRITARAFLEHAPRLFALTPLRHVQILDLDCWADALAMCPFLDRLTTLTLHAQHSGPALAAALARSPYLNHLRQLCLSRNRLGDEGIAYLCQRVWPALEHLDLTHNHLTEATAALLQKNARCFPRLRVLQGRDNHLGPQGVARLATGPLREQLTALGLARNHIGLGNPTDVFPRLLTIPCLDLADNHLSAATLASVGLNHRTIAIPHRLRYLDLSHNELTDAGAGALAQACGLRQLRTLILVCCNIGDAGATALARSEHFPQLHTLDLSNNPISAAGFTSFLTPTLCRLTQLRHLYYTPLALPHHLQLELERRFPPEPHRSQFPTLDTIDSFTV
jgi:uncharacterized protein (TIGR02996 family)